MRKAAWGLILILILVVALAGCSSGVSKDKYNKVKSDLDQANQKLVDNEQILITRDQELNTANATIADIQAQLNALKATEQTAMLLQQQLNTATMTIADLQALLDALEYPEQTIILLQQQLNACRSTICPLTPLREFTTVSELESWVSSHMEPAPTTAGQAFRTAVKIQKAAVQEGYIMSVTAEYDETIKQYRVRCQAFVENSLYHWSPGTPGVFVDYPGGQLLLP
ncbi:MAG: hypothetical protein PHV74_10080 [Dehalococcoidia bacterium]|nr:hypothetical protein [Dehalococcoidia bacterium]